MKRFGVLLLAALLASCGRATYSQDRVAESLIQLCKNEYGLKVKAQFVKTTLGVMVEVPGLIDELRKHAPDSIPEAPPVLIEGRYTQDAFDFRVVTKGSFVRVPRRLPDDDRPPREPSAPIKKLQQVSTAIMRICLSTDAPVEFYKLIARDPGPDHLDVIFAGHVLDSKRVQFYAISVSDLQSRNEISLRRQPEEIARATVFQFIRDLRTKPLSQLLSRYAAPSKRFGDLMPMISRVTADLNGEEEKILEEMEQWPVRQIEKDAVLLCVPLHAVGDPGAFLFTVQIQDTDGSLSAIDRLGTLSSLTSAHQHLGSPEHWGDSFYLEPLSLPVFLADQIAKRAMTEFKPVDPESPKAASLKLSTADEVARALLDATTYVVKSYDFKDFQEITVVDALKGTRWAVPAAELPLYQRRNSPDLKPVP